MAGATGYTPISNSDAFGFDQINAGFATLDGKLATSVATPADLPASGNWFGRLLSAASTKYVYLWDGTAWTVVGGQTPAFTVLSNAAQSLSGPAETTLSGVWGTPSISRGFASFTGGILTTSISGWYSVSFSAFLTTAANSSAIVDLNGSRHYQDNARASIGNSWTGFVPAGGTISAAVYVDSANSLQNARTMLAAKWVGA